MMIDLPTHSKTYRTLFFDLDTGLFCGIGLVDMKASFFIPKYPTEG